MRPQAIPSGMAGIAVDADLQRIVVVGGNGAGKTTFATSLAISLDLPLLHNDGFSLSHGWAARPSADASALRADAVRSTQWILEGGPSCLRPEVLRRTDLVVWLDLPLMLRMRRVLWRALKLWGRQRPELPEGAIEGFGPRTFRFLWQMWRRRAWDREVVPDRLAAFQGPVWRLRSPWEVAVGLSRATEISPKFQGVSNFGEI